MSPRFSQTVILNGEPYQEGVWKSKKRTETMDVDPIYVVRQKQQFIIIQWSI